jgi:hypothetical protein
LTPAVSGGIGLLVGLHIASWGAYKDAPYEGFRIISYLRSVLLAATLAILITVFAPELAPTIVVLVGAVYAIERLATEGWKSILRKEDQTRYTIPMRLGFRGRPVHRGGIRYTAGAVLGSGIIAALLELKSLQHGLQPVPALLVILTVGSAGGWATAAGGAWQDAPIEGFNGWKFLRSPAVAAAWAMPIFFLTNSWVALLLASGGFAVASIETYKTFLTGGRPPGKFSGRPVRAHLPALRNMFAHQHAILWMAMAATFAAILAGPHRGLPHDSADILFPELPYTLLATAAVGAGGLGTLVIYTGGRRRTQEIEASHPPPKTQLSATQDEPSIP